MADDNKNKLIVHSLNPRELIEWCNSRCKEKHLSRAKLAEITGVPESTLDRILTGKNPEFRYSTIQPIIAYLIEFDEDTPEPEDNTKQEEFYYNTIEGYKLIVENKNHVINEYEKAYKKLEEEVVFLKEDNNKRAGVISKMQEHIEWMQSVIDGLSKMKA